MVRGKKAISGVVTAVILIALAIAIVAIVWVVVNNLVQEELDEAGSCFEIFNKVTINPRFTCHNDTGNELQFSVSVGDIDVDEALVSVAGQGTTRSFTLSSVAGPVTNIVTYPDRETSVQLPGKNSGLTYILDLTAAGFSGVPTAIEIAPKVGGNQCDVSDSLGQIDDCQLLS